jgi:hypothetical protein
MDAHDRRSLEVEQILPSHEPVQDPRHFYASDSPLNSDLELYKSAEEFEEDVDPGVQDESDDPQASSNFVRSLIV